MSTKTLRIVKGTTGKEPHRFTFEELKKLEEGTCCTFHAVTGV
jgi:hypothetical protein